MAVAFAKIAFTPSVRAQQERLGSGRYSKLLSDERQGGDRLGPQEAAFIAQRDGFYQATVSETGWPYVQFRGGPPGFLKVLDEQTIAYADLRGNRQYLSLGNLTANDRIALILLDYVEARRLKIWGRASVIETGAEAENRKSDADAPRLRSETQTERYISIKVEAVDWNCPSHIPRRFTDTEATREIEGLTAANADLRAENARLRIEAARRSES